MLYGSGVTAKLAEKIALGTGGEISISDCIGHVFDKKSSGFAFGTPHCLFDMPLDSNTIYGNVSKSDVKTKSEQAEPSVLGRIANGDREAMSDCIRLYGGLVWSLARRMLRDAADAEDIVQEIFLELWKNAERFDPATASETTFVAMIARRRIIDRMRSVSRRPYSESLDDLLIEPSKDGAREIETRLEANRAAVALESLRKEQKDILKLSILGGMSHSEIADALGIPLGTVKTHARRGLLEMRRFLDDGKNFKEVTA